MFNMFATSKKSIKATRLAILASLLSLLSVSSLLSQPAHAFWFFGKKHNGKAVERKKRELHGVQVGLLPGNPPATYWQAKSSPKAVVLCLHELGLYAGVFDDLGQRLGKENMAVYAIDLRGFGGWKTIDSKDSEMNLPKTLADVKGSCEVIHKLHPGLPVFILGEAMGGALALDAAAKFPELISGVITAAPGGEHFNTINNFAKVASSKVVGAKHVFGLGETIMDAATPKEELKDALSGDEMVRMDVTNDEMMACQFFMYKTKNMAKEIKTTPVLVVHGDQDHESRPIGSRNVFQNLATNDKKFEALANGDHYTYEDTKVDDRAFEVALNWLNAHVIASN